MLKQRELASFRAFVDERYRTRTLASHLRAAPIFDGLDDAAIEHLRQCAELVPFDPGATIVEQGSTGDAFYLVRGGYVRVGVGTGAAELAVTYLRKGDHAGEIPLLGGRPWPVSLRALEHVEMVRILRADFMGVVQRFPEVGRRLKQSSDRRLDETRLALERPNETRYLQMAMDTGLINGESVLLIDLETCTRCDDCVRACADSHAGTPRFIREGARYGRWSVPMACYQCTDPVCMIGCPTGAISRPLGSFEVTINRDTCIGCHNCVRRCPWGNIIEVPFESPQVNRTIDLATKCDHCVGRAHGPACVEACPHGSAIRISFKDLGRVVSTLSR
jgi:Fe-S-cluster-containing hydrogenase component 2